MCGICGQLDFTGSPVDKDLLRRMMALMVHRGPDDSGVYLRPRGNIGCGLGHWRQSIIEKQGIFHYPVIENLVENLMHDRTDTFWQIWNLIAFQALYESYMQ